MLPQCRSRAHTTCCCEKRQYLYGSGARLDTSDRCALTEIGRISFKLGSTGKQWEHDLFSAADLIGYATSRYAITGKKGAGVRLRFVSAEETRNGKTVPMANPPILPFELPRKLENIRLIYLVRVSKADHNMAIAGSKHLESLSALTERLKANPSVCKSSDDIFCSWVPAGVAVRPER